MIRDLDRVSNSDRNDEGADRDQQAFAISHVVISEICEYQANAGNDNKD